jgi:citrate/tricarballylate utilization protein
MLELDLTQELGRQLAVCNACRYCEGFCAVFGAAELHGAIGSGEVAYLANLCHDCRMCFDACMFTAPHEYALNIPAAMTEARADTYAAYGKPAAFAALFRRPARAAWIAVGAAVILIAAAVALYAGPEALRPQLGPGAFYRLVPYAAIVGVALAVALYGLVSIVVSARGFAHDIGNGVRFTSVASLGVAVRQALALTYLKGGGAGCYDEARGSGRRRLYHSLVFWGFSADFAATISAAILQDFLHRLPPYPLWSLPVVLGTIGGVALSIGATGLIAVKRRSDARPTSPRMVALDYAFLGLLELAALTGLALLALRSTGAMGALLVLHLGAVAGLALTAPYGKFVHFIYRFIALVKNAHDRSGDAA